MSEVFLNVYVHGLRLLHVVLWDGFSCLRLAWKSSSHCRRFNPCGLISSFNSALIVLPSICSYSNVFCCVHMAYTTTYTITINAHIHTYHTHDTDTISLIRSRATTLCRGWEWASTTQVSRSTTQSTRIPTVESHAPSPSWAPSGDWGSRWVIL